MLLKWIFTLIAIAWLYQALKPFFAIDPSKPTPKKKDKQDDDGEYIDYEELE